MEFSLDRQYLATADEEGIINIWKVIEPTQEMLEENPTEVIFEEEPYLTFKGHTVYLLQLFQYIYILVAYS